MVGKDIGEKASWGKGVFSHWRKKIRGEKECQVMGGKRPRGKKSVRPWEENVSGGKGVSSYGRNKLGGKKSVRIGEEEEFIITGGKGVSLLWEEKDPEVIVHLG